MTWLLVKYNIIIKYYINKYLINNISLLKKVKNKKKKLNHLVTLKILFYNHFKLLLVGGMWYYYEP